MKNTIKAFICPHIDDEYTLCQDRFCVDCDNDFFAVSDGVSSSFSPTYYAEIISSYFENGTVSISKEDAKVIFSKWQNYIEDLLSKGKLGRASKQRYQRGEVPSATYARFKVSKQNNCFTWDSAVLGDCAIIQAHRYDDRICIEHVILSGDKFVNDNFLYQNAADYYRFGRLPDQLDKDGTFLDAEAVLKNIPLREGDVFVLCTDGMSDWILNDSSKTNERLNSIMTLENQEDFLTLVEKERTSSNSIGRNMENDDITVIIVEFNDIKKGILQYDKKYVANISELIAAEKQNVLAAAVPYSETIEGDDKKNESTIIPVVSSDIQEETSESGRDNEIKKKKLIEKFREIINTLSITELIILFVQFLVLVFLCTNIFIMFIILSFLINFLK